MTLAMVVLLTVAQMEAAVSAESVKFYVQLVQGTYGDTPPVAGATLVGNTLGNRLRMFKWKNYWEVKRQTVQVQIGGKARQHLTPKRDVEISLPAADQMTVCIYVEGKLTRKRKQHVSSAFYIAGGQNEDTKSWFIVVRRDKPENAPCTQAQSPLGNPYQRAFGQFVVQR